MPIRWSKIYIYSEPPELAQKLCRPIQYLDCGSVLVIFKSGARHVVDPLALRVVEDERKTSQLGAVLNRWTTWGEL